MARRNRRPNPAQKQAVHSTFACPAGAVVVNGYSEEWLRKGFCWVYAKEIEAKGDGVTPGGAVTILNRKGVVLGAGLYDPGDIAVRRFSEGDGPCDAQRLAQLTDEALVRRGPLLGADAVRLVHGENDALPGFRIDAWGDWLNIIVDVPSLVDHVSPLLETIENRRAFAGVICSHRKKGGQPQVLVGGEVPEALVVEEAGARFEIRLHEGPDVGLYCDMRDVRRWLAPHWRGARVLNTFAYTGAYTVAAALGGAERVTHVDLSPKHMDWARRNAAFNGIEADWVQDDVRKALDRLRRTGAQFDRIILDPPAFSTSEQGVFSVERDYARMVGQALRVLAPGGWLLAATNQGSVSPKQFQQFLTDGARKAGRRLHLIHQGSPPLDFPAALAFPESRYLKAWVVACP